MDGWEGMLRRFWEENKVLVEGYGRSGVGDGRGWRMGLGDLEDQKRGRFRRGWLGRVAFRVKGLGRAMILLGERGILRGFWGRKSGLR